jgi:hypothetical protein
VPCNEKRDADGTGSVRYLDRRDIPAGAALDRTTITVYCDLAAVPPFQGVSPPVN